ncbi:MAG: PorP/SprF family type IX secretion system membrane protein [Capnocytophaga sp.]|nr:PorP/SprF family type IX secretion system membrane protein [Capnocytophaga sp.]
MKKSYKILFSLAVAFSAKFMNAQTTSFIFYNEQQNIVNPAAVGTEKGHTVLLNLRSQWFNSNQDNPQVQTLNTTHRVTDRIGLGASVVSDKIFSQRETAFYADFSYSLPITEESNLYLGLKAGGDLYSLDGNRFRTYNETYDPYLQSLSGKFQPNVGVGAYYKTPKFYAGVSAPNLLASDKTKVNNEVVTSVSQQMVFYAMGGYYFRINQDFTIVPRFQMYFAKNTQYQLSATASVLYTDFIEAGVTYRTTQALNGYLLFRVPSYNFSVGYGFESYLQPKVTSSLRNVHEFIVALHF